MQCEKSGKNRDFIENIEKWIFGNSEIYESKVCGLTAFGS